MFATIDQEVNPFFIVSKWILPEYAVGSDPAESELLWLRLTEADQDRIEAEECDWLDSAPVVQVVDCGAESDSRAPSKTGALASPFQVDLAQGDPAKRSVRGTATPRSQIVQTTYWVRDSPIGKVCQVEFEVADPRNAWRFRARELGEWTKKYICNRQDSWGAYLPYEKRSSTNCFTQNGRLTDLILAGHFLGSSVGQLIGLHTTSRDAVGRCWSRWGLIDIDKHDDNEDHIKNWKIVTSVYRELLSHGIKPVLEESNGRGGYHLWVVFDKPVESERVYSLLQWLVRDYRSFGFSKAPEIFPKQPEIPRGQSHGNWVRLPGRHHTRNHWSLIWNGLEWLQGDEAIDTLLNTPAATADLIPAESEGFGIALPSTSRRRQSASESPETADPQVVEGALACLPHMASEYNSWIHIGMCLKSMGDTGLRLWTEWSAQVPGKFSEGECTKKWATFTAGQSGDLGLGTIFHLAKAAGWPDTKRQIDPVALQARLDTHLAAGDPAALYRDDSLIRDLATLKLDDLGEFQIAREKVGQAKWAGFRLTNFDEQIKNSSSVIKKERKQIAKSFVQSTGFLFSDLGNAQRLIRAHSGKIRYCKAYGDWLVYDGRRWQVNPGLEIEKLANRISEQVRDEIPENASPEAIAAYANWALKSEMREKINACLSVARAEVAIQPRDLDADPWILNVENGTIHLKTGEFREHAPDDLVTKFAPVVYDPQATCPVWDQTILEIMGDDPEAVDFLQRAFGYATTGIIREHALLICYGGGSNGKTLTFNTVKGVLGSYAIDIESEILIQQTNSQHPTGLTDLEGTRFVVAEETSDSHYLDEALVKKLTGGNSIRARKMHKDFYEFDPSHHLFMSTNHRPKIRNMDFGIWRRLKIVPFTQTWHATKPGARRPDLQIQEKLRAERSGILNWLLKGCREWQARGLEEPKAILAATADYREEQDDLGLFLKEQCVFEPDQKIENKYLYREYKAWCENNGLVPKEKQEVGTSLNDRGATTRKSGSVLWKVGIRLKTDQEKLDDLEKSRNAIDD